MRIECGACDKSHNREDKAAACRQKKAGELAAREPKAAPQPLKAARPTVTAGELIRDYVERQTGFYRVGGTS